MSFPEQQIYVWRYFLSLRPNHIFSIAIVVKAGLNDGQ